MARQAVNYRRQARQAAKRHGLNPDLFERQIGAESNFDPKAVSPAGARGIAQIMPETAKGWGVDPDDPIAALDAAARNMAEYVNRYGSEHDALVAYNAGPGRVGKPLYAETRAYVDKILGNTSGAGRKSRAKGSQRALPAMTVGAEPGGTDQGAVLQAALDMIGGGSGPLEFAQAVQGATTAADPGVELPGVPAAPQGPQTPESGEGGDLPHLPKSLQGLAETTRRTMSRHGFKGGSGHRSEAQNAEAGGADDSDHLWHRGKRWAEDYPASGEQLHAGARTIAKRYGIRDWDGEGMVEATIQRGRKTFRVQVLAGASVGHDDHIHVGIREI